jgi:hypothetical protein
MDVSFIHAYLLHNNVTFATRSLRLVPLCTGQRMTNLNLSLIALSIQLQFWSVTLHDGLNKFHVCMYVYPNSVLDSDNYVPVRGRS